MQTRQTAWKANLPGSVLIAAALQLGLSFRPSSAVLAGSWLWLVPGKQLCAEPQAGKSEMFVLEAKGCCPKAGRLQTLRTMGI